jgi:hypothetical protein
MDEAAERDRAGQAHHRAPSDERRHEERMHEEAERIAVEGDDLSEIFGAVLGRERPHVDEEPPGGVSWPPRLGKRSGQRADDPNRPDEP